MREKETRSAKRENTGRGRSAGRENHYVEEILIHAVALQRILCSDLL
jgi:hypothetical protein